MQRIIIASKNPVKIKAAENAFCKMFPEEKFICAGVFAQSEVSEQPKSDAETLKGAQNRAKNAKIQIPEADFWVGLEGGIEDDSKEIVNFAWAFILGKNMEGKARMASFILPQRMAELGNCSGALKTAVLVPGTKRIKSIR